MSHLYQYSHASIFTQKAYDGTGSIEQLKPHGDIGLGTFNSLNGELVVVDGEFYQCLEEKHIKQASDNALMPWAAVTRFTDSASTITLQPVKTFSELETIILSLIHTKNTPYVFHIKAHCNDILFRQVVKQNKPYSLSIDEVYAKSPTNHTGPVKADLVGFYIPDFMQSIHPTGLHLHGLTEDKLSGGHVLELNFYTALLTFEAITDVTMTLLPS
ncbi:MAG: acetolactate decarboxylase [Legionellaceae bacterium]|nr:acetolactate decarboxylase [Legionellaceae bacterium]